jgi:hypothetical protein
LLGAMEAHAAGRLSATEAQFVEAVRDTIVRFEATGSLVVTDGEQRKSSFATTGERLDARARARGGYRGWGVAA